MGFLLFNKKSWIPRFVTLENLSWSVVNSWPLGNKKRGKEIFFVSLYVFHKFYLYVNKKSWQVQYLNFTHDHFWTKAYINLNSPKKNFKRILLLSYSYFSLKKKSDLPPNFFFITFSSQFLQGFLR